MATMVESVASSSSLTLDLDPSLTPTITKWPAKNPHPKLRVLVVDDNLLNLRVMKQLLKKMSAFTDLDKLRTASSGLEALELLGAEPFDLLFLDISMPGMSGLEVCRRLRECGRPTGKLHVCAVTTDLADWQIELYRLAGMNGVIGKPLKGPDLEYALRACELSAPQRVDHPSPDFYFCRHGVLQPLPEHCRAREVRAEVERMDSGATLCTTPSTVITPRTAQLPNASQPDEDQESAQVATSRKQSVVSEALIGGVLVFDDAEPNLHRRRLERPDLPLPHTSRPLLSRIDTSTTRSSISSAPSSAPSAVSDSITRLPVIGLFGHTGLHYQPPLITAPILECHGDRQCRAGVLRRYGSLSRTSSADCCLAVREEPDVFAAGFGAAVSETSEYDCLHWDGLCKSVEANPEVVEKTPEDIGSDNEGRRPQPVNERWAQLADPIPTTGSSSSSTVSAVTRQLLTRRSQPILSMTVTAEQLEDEARVRIQKSRSIAGTPVRPSWQLVQLNSIYYQSVLKSGELLDEVLLALDLESEEEAVGNLECKRHHIPISSIPLRFTDTNLFD